MYCLKQIWNKYLFKLQLGFLLLAAKYILNCSLQFLYISCPHFLCVVNASFWVLLPLWTQLASSILTHILQEGVTFVPEFPGPGSRNPAGIYCRRLWLENSWWVPLIWVGPGGRPLTLAEPYRPWVSPRSACDFHKSGDLRLAPTVALGVEWVTFCQSQGQKFALGSQV